MAAGLDGAIISEALHNCGDAMVDIVHGFCTEVYNTLTKAMRSRSISLKGTWMVFKIISFTFAVTFIDFKKAFDSIDRKVMFTVLRHYGIPESAVNVISTLYNVNT